MSNRLRVLLGSLQVPVAALGALLCIGAVVLVLSIPDPPPGGDGLPGGLAFVFGLVMSFVGFAVCGIGLAIPPGPGYGIGFTRRQRGLFVLSAAATAAGMVLPFLAMPTAMGGGLEPVVYLWMLLVGTAVLSLAGGLVWRAFEPPD